MSSELDIRSSQKVEKLSGVNGVNRLHLVVDMEKVYDEYGGHTFFQEKVAIVAAKYNLDATIFHDYRNRVLDVKFTRRNND